jgi:hypothetical protein
VADPVTDTRPLEVGEERLVVALALLGGPTICWGPRSLPACGSMATTSTPSGAAVASTMAERPW